MITRSEILKNKICHVKQFLRCLSTNCVSSYAMLTMTKKKGTVRE